MCLAESESDKPTNYGPKEPLKLNREKELNQHRLAPQDAMTRLHNDLQIGMKDTLGLKLPSDGHEDGLSA